VRVIQQALDAGFTIEDLARVFKQRDAGGAPCREVLRIAHTRLGELDQRIAGLSALRRQLGRVIGEWEARLAITPAGRQAGLLDGLANTPSVARAGSLRRPAPKRARVKQTPQTRAIFRLKAEATAILAEATALFNDRNSQQPAGP
jgi:DNA-binding transcriptional MerR regulator